MENKFREKGKLCSSPDFINRSYTHTLSYNILEREHGFWNLARPELETQFCYLSGVPLYVSNSRLGTMNFSGQMGRLIFNSFDKPEMEKPLLSCALGYGI